MADAFEALIEMWNSENKKKKMILEMKMSNVTTIKRSNTFINETNVNKKENFKRHNSFCLYEENNDKKSFKINNNESKKDKKKRCSC